MSDLAIKKDEETGLSIVDYDESTSNVGFEQQDEDDRKKVWLKQLQGTSRECKNKYRVEGARPGMFYQTGVGRLWEDGIEITICTTEKCFVEWKPDGGGFLGKHQKGGAVWKEAHVFSDPRGIFPLQLKNGNKLIDTRYLHILTPGLSDEDVWEYSVFSVASTKITPYRELMDDITKYRAINLAGKKVKPPLAAFRIKLSSFDTESKGQEFSGILMEGAVDNNLDSSLLPNGHPRVVAGMQIAEAFTAGEINVDYASEGEGEDDGIRDVEMELIDGKEAF